MKVRNLVNVLTVGSSNHLNCHGLDFPAIYEERPNVFQIAHNDPRLIPLIGMNALLICELLQLQDIDFDTEVEWPIVKISSLDETLPTLKQILSNCLNALDNAYNDPNSVVANLASAIAALYELVPDYTPSCKDTEDALEWALKKGRVLRGEEK